MMHYIIKVYYAAYITLYIQNCKKFSFSFYMDVNFPATENHVFEKKNNINVI